VYDLSLGCRKIFLYPYVNIVHLFDRPNSVICKNLVKLKL